MDGAGLAAVCSAHMSCACSCCPSGTPLPVSQLSDGQLSDGQGRKEQLGSCAHCIVMFVQSHCGTVSCR